MIRNLLREAINSLIVRDPASSGKSRNAAMGVPDAQDASVDRGRVVQSLHDLSLNSRSEAKDIVHFTSDDYESKQRQELSIIWMARTV